MDLPAIAEDSDHVEDFVMLQLSAAVQEGFACDGVEELRSLSDSKLTAEE
jgi:hypothetical protein